MQTNNIFCIFKDRYFLKKDEILSYIGFEIPMQHATRSSLLYAVGPAAMGICGTRDQLPYVTFDEGIDIFFPLGLGPAIPELGPLQTLKEPFKEVISDRAYR